MISLAQQGGRGVGFPTPFPSHRTKESILDGPLTREPGVATLVPEQGSGYPQLGRLLAILWVRKGLRDVAQLAIRATEATFGRAADNDLVLDSPAVSAYHGRLALADGVWTLTDLDSINGSWVDGERIAGSAHLTPGSEVRIADVVLSFAPRDEWSDSPVSEQVEMSPRERPAPLFLPQDDSSGPRRLLIGASAVVILGLLAYLLLATR